MEEEDNDGREGDKKSEDVAQAAEHAGKTKHDSENVQESEHARDATANNEEQEVGRLYLSIMAYPSKLRKKRSCSCIA